MGKFFVDDDLHKFIQDAMQTLAVPHTMIDKEGARDLKINNGEVKFDRVSFTYGRNIGGLKDVSLRIKAFEKLGVVGHQARVSQHCLSSNLHFSGFMMTESGSIHIDGQNIGDVKQNSLRRNISMVTQEASMFNRTARENILYGKPDASEEEVCCRYRKS